MPCSKELAIRAELPVSRDPPVAGPDKGLAQRRNPRVAPTGEGGRAEGHFLLPQAVFDGGAKPQVAWAVGLSGRHLSRYEDLLAEAA